MLAVRRPGRINERASWSRGFTLIEMILGLLIFALIGAGLSGLLVRASTLQQQAADLFRVHHDARFAFDMLGRDLENAVPFVDETNGVKAFRGTRDRLACVVPTDRGLASTEYLLGDLDLGTRKTTVVRHIKNIREAFDAQSGGRAAVQFLFRQQSWLTADVKAAPLPAESEVIAGGIKKAGLNFLYGAFQRQGERVTGVDFKPEWQDNILPDVVRVTCTFAERSEKDEGIVFHRDFFPVIKERHP